ncbi:DUF2147 domain-containing protein [Puniceicoccales bacterium CK1056]|uniref:DUF2147 domain-containing protein n=1 Tax=Oceanipulchritudo coccoides TaxID=2706888 RepID=A0A6B2M2N2_9BACT|nr:DUF2147 domain-containing protein [Oceanipulchritudo coccoides]NDV63003.1 DUF2147 domain-containing protein [Oceanipulchritudo coccoides]
MKLSRLVTFTLLCLLVHLSATAAGMTGIWKTIDDATGKTKSLVEIYRTPEGQLEGRIIEILHSDRGPNPLCDDCPGDRKGKPIKGMVILWDMDSASETKAVGGRILDPKNGKVYKAKLSLRDDGKLEVRGFIGFSLLGRTQVWEPAS